MLSNKQVHYKLFREVYPLCRNLVSKEIWHHLVDRAAAPELFPDILMEAGAAEELPGYIAELARLELYVSGLNAESIPIAPYAEKLSLNPTLQLFENTWRNLAGQINGAAGTPGPEKGGERIIVWRHPASGRIKAKPAAPDDLLAMKIALEALAVGTVAHEGGVQEAAVASILIRALDDGIVIGPQPLIKREWGPEQYREVAPAFLTARIFSLQWHITQACDLHCRHCYDRSNYKSLSLPQEIAILDDLARFCAAHNVHGQVTFTGGNPLLHPHFATLYQEAAKRGFTTAILGNPTTREEIERLQAIQPLAFYQVSLEGLAEHNDYMRGSGHFEKILGFLALLRELGVFSMVMLTLTRDNMDQVLPLAELLRHRTDLFTFNRLSLVGEGANLAAVDPEKYPDFLRAYAEAVGTNPCLGRKDNLLNILYHGQKQPLFGGCTGCGCGAAFNFITVLADGAVHACRKFPSPLGNILENSLDAIYHSAAAARYRGGATECQQCAIRPVCGGCLAVAHSHGLDVFRQKDPYCFIDSEFFRS